MPAVASVEFAHRYGSCALPIFGVVDPLMVTIFFVANAEARAGAPPVAQRVWSNTMKGFLAAMAVASARCAVSSAPLASTTSKSIVRPQV